MCAVSWPSLPYPTTPDVSSAVQPGTKPMASTCKVIPSTPTVITSDPFRARTSSGVTTGVSARSALIQASSERIADNEWYPGRCARNTMGCWSSTRYVAFSERLNNRSGVCGSRP
ncbi:Uncharacterised protein [Mycobacteroides abscessus subsp. abscessus]|nr:Uncharacterised protein [Mycobacteroides abscessus subsp. abscessus]